jgi:hypothetical protein
VKIICNNSPKSFYKVFPCKLLGSHETINCFNCTSQHPHKSTTNQCKHSSIKVYFIEWNLQTNHCSLKKKTKEKLMNENILHVLCFLFVLSNVKKEERYLTNTTISFKVSSTKLHCIVYCLLLVMLILKQSIKTKVFLKAYT